MMYQQSINIERRLATILDLIRTGMYSTPQIAEVVGVSIPTVSRDVMALRQRGHNIRSEKSAEGWRYVLSGDDALDSAEPREIAGLRA